MKLLLLLIGLGGGAAASTSWLLSTPEGPEQPLAPTDADTVRARIELLRVRFSQALTEGQRVGQQTETRLRQELDAYRRGASA